MQPKHYSYLLMVVHKKIKEVQKKYMNQTSVEVTTEDYTDISRNIIMYRKSTSLFLAPVSTSVKWQTDCSWETNYEMGQMQKWNILKNSYIVI